ncbi:MAG: type IV pilin protein, partial [Pseudomonadota bacterium]
VAILGIVAAIAYPSYQDRTRRAKRTDAKVALINLAASQERFFLRNNRYTTDLSELGIAGTENGFYELTITSNGASEFQATAEPTGTTGTGQFLDTKCKTFVIDQTGRKTATGDGGDTSQECWQR